LARLARSGCHRLESGIEEEQFFAGILSLGKIQKGIAKLDDGKRRRVIQTWLTRMYANVLMVVLCR
jgi:hypothetical protein